MSERPSRPAPPQPVFGKLRSQLAEAPVAVALWTGFVAAALSCLISIGIALLLWIPDADATATSSSIVHAGVVTFLISLHGGAHLNGVHVGFVPLGMTVAAVAACARFARPVWAHPRVGTVSTARIVAAQAGAYAATCLLLVPFARLGTTWLGWTGTLLGGAVVAAVGFAAAARRAGALTVARQVPAAVRTAGRAATAGVAVLLAGGAVLSAAAIVLQHGRFTALSRALAGGVSSLPLALLETLTAPNAVIAGAAYLAGPGFEVGAAHYALSGNRTAAVPAFPILSGLPEGAGSAPLQVLALAALTVLGAGLAAGWLVHRGRRADGWKAGLGTAVLSGVATGAAMAVLSALADGALGAHALRAVGPSPLWMGLVVSAEVGTVALLTDLALRITAAVRAHRAAAARPTHAPTPADDTAERAVPTAAKPSLTQEADATTTTVQLPTIKPRTASATASIRAPEDADDLPTAAAS